MLVSFDVPNNACGMTKPVTPRSFGSDWNAVLAHWAQGGPVNSSAKAGWAALEALERLRPGYLTQYFEKLVLGNAEFAHLLAHGLDLVACEGLPGLEALLGRIEHGERGATVELGVLAFLVRSGFTPVIEPTLGGKVPDFALDVADCRVFGEVIGPTWSDAAARLQAQLQKAASTLFACVGPNKRLQVGFLSEPSAVIVDRVTAAMNDLAGSAGVVPIGEVALGRLDPLSDEVTGLDLGTAPAIGCAQFEFDAGGGRVVNATAVFSDERAQRLIAGELRHFSREQPNVLVVDVGAVVGGLGGWGPPDRALLSADPKYATGRRTHTGTTFRRRSRARSVARQGAPESVRRNASAWCARGRAGERADERLRHVAARIADSPDLVSGRRRRQPPRRVEPGGCHFRSAVHCT